MQNPVVMKTSTNTNINDIIMLRYNGWQRAAPRIIRVIATNVPTRSVQLSGFRYQVLEVYTETGWKKLSDPSAPETRKHYTMSHQTFENIAKMSR